MFIEAEARFTLFHFDFYAWFSRATLPVETHHGKSISQRRHVIDIYGGCVGCIMQNDIRVCPSQRGLSKEGHKV